MNPAATILAKWLIALCALFAVCLTVLSVMDKHDVETYTVLGGGIATALGAVAGFVVGAKLDRPETPAQPSALSQPLQPPRPLGQPVRGEGTPPTNPVAPPKAFLATGPDVGAQQGSYAPAPVTLEDLQRHIP